MKSARMLPLCLFIATLGANLGFARVAAADIHCAETTVRHIFITKGDVRLSLGSAAQTSPAGYAVSSFFWNRVCNLDVTTDGITAATCRSWLALMQAAYLAQSPLIVWFSNGNQSKCANQSWQNLTPFVTSISVGTY